MVGGKTIDSLTAPEKKAESLSQESEGPENTKEEVLLSWIAPNFDYKDKNFSWYLILSLIILAVIGYFVFMQDWFSIGIIVVISGVLFWYLKKVRPEETTYSVTPFGIYSGKHFYPFSEIHSFWMVYDQKVKKVYIAFVKKYLPALVIGLGDQSPLDLKEVLLKYIPEQEKRGEGLVDKLIRMIGF